jgi:hypothetical protein
VASRGLAEDVDAPVFVDRLPDDVSPVQVAEAIEQRLSTRWGAEDLELLRLDYVEQKSPARYATSLLDCLREVIHLPTTR